jgi:hypothetical protein
MFDEMVQRIYMYLYMDVLCGKTRQKEAEIHSPGWIFDRLRTSGDVAQ